MERQRLTGERDRLASSLAASRSKLENETFLSKAPAEVVEREREKLADMGERYAKLEDLLAGLND